MAEAAGALAAIGLASNVVSFIDLALRLYRSASGQFDGLAQELKDTTDLTTILRDHVAALARRDEACADDQLIGQIARQCQAIAQNLLDVLRKYRVGGQKLRQIAMAKQAIRAAWNRRNITDTQALLEKYHGQLMSHVIVSYR